MARLRFSPGVRYLNDGQVFVVCRVLVEGRLLVENQSSGGHAVVSHDDLTAAWAAGMLQFEVRGPNTRRHDNAPLPQHTPLLIFNTFPRRPAMRRGGGIACCFRC